MLQRRMQTAEEGGATGKAKQTVGERRTLPQRREEKSVGLGMHVGGSLPGTWCGSTEGGTDTKEEVMRGGKEAPMKHVWLFAECALLWQEDLLSSADLRVGPEIAHSVELPLPFLRALLCSEDSHCTWLH